jgi:hypothetical protein
VIRKDYIIRLIEQFGLLWARLLAQLRAGLFPDARNTLDLAYQQLLGLNADTVRAQSSGELLARLRLGETPEAGHARCCMLAALLGAEGELATAQHDPDMGAFFYQKALDIVLALRLHQPALPLPEHAPTVERLEAALADYQLPFDTRRLLFQYHEQQGDFARAENDLFELLDLHSDTAAVAALGQGFYDRLEQRDDAELHTGNFSRPEIAAGRKELRRIARGK